MASPTAIRGRCSGCHYRARLRRDGTIGPHKGALVPPECEGLGKPPLKVKFSDSNHPDCGECLMYLYSRELHGAALVEAISSVAIESGGNPQEMFRNYISAYHDRDHQEAQ